MGQWIYGTVVVSGSWGCKISLTDVGLKYVVDRWLHQSGDMGQWIYGTVDLWDSGYDSIQNTRFGF